MARKKIKDTEEFIIEARKIHGNKYDYSKVKYVGKKKKVCIICPIHGEFWQYAYLHLKGHGCPKCGGVVKLTLEEFIEKARKVHGDKYDYSKVIYINNETKVCIICPIHGEFWQTPSNHLRGNNCPTCVNHVMALTTEEFIKQARKVHGDRYDYSKVVYKSKRSKVCIICPIHGEFWQTPSNHLLGQRCPKCAGKIRYTKEMFIEKAREIHGDKYDYSKVEFKTVVDKVEIICPIHGSFFQTPSKHLMGRGCQKCGKTQRFTTEEYINECKKVWGDTYLYDKIGYVNMLTPIIVGCKKHGYFNTNPRTFLQGYGCKKCGASKLELSVMSMLENNNIEYIFEANIIHFPWIGHQSVDFYLPKYNIAIECQGQQHFIPVNFGSMSEDERNKRFEYTLRCDEKKRLKCKENGLKLLYYSDAKVEYPYDVYSNLEDLLKEILK